MIDDVTRIDMTVTDSDDVAMDATYVVRSSSAIYMTITSDNGTAFKNSTGSTVMTAHVFRGGAELSDEEVSMIGLIQWYKNANAVGTGKTLSVAASSVDSTSVYRARLEA